MMKGIWGEENDERFWEIEEANILFGSVIDISHYKRMLSPGPRNVNVNVDTLIVCVCVWMF